MITFLWDNVLVNPMSNGLIALDRMFFGNFGLAIIAFTVIMRVVTFPLTMRQLRSTRLMSELQPKMQELQKKHKDPKRRNEETMKLYREAGVNPLGCLFPMLVQFPVWIALYQVVRLVLAGAPENYIDLSQRLYPVAFIQHAVPVSDSFLWMDLGSQDRLFILPLLVAASMWAQQRTMMQRNAPRDSQQQQMNNTMLWMMPLMFGWFSTTVPSGLALYWFATNVIGIVMNGFVFGFHELHPLRMFSLPAGAGGLRPPSRKREPDRAQPAPAVTVAKPGPDVADEGERMSDGRQRGSKRKNRRGSRRAGPPPARP